MKDEYKRIRAIDLKEFKNVEKNNDGVIYIEKTNNIFEKVMNDKPITKTSSKMLWIILIISVLVVVVEMVVEIMGYKNVIVNLLFQLSIAYIISCIFYYLTVITPQKIKMKKTNNIIVFRLDSLYRNIKELCDKISDQTYSGMEENGEITNSKLSVDFGVDSGVYYINSMNCDKPSPIKLYDWYSDKAKEIREQARDLLMLYHSDMTADMYVVIEAILNDIIISDDYCSLIKSNPKLILVDFYTNYMKFWNKGKKINDEIERIQSEGLC